MKHARIAWLAAPLALGACVSPPTGPSVAALPGTGKSGQQFAADDANCRNYATYATGGVSPSDAAGNAGVGSAVAGAALGAGTGALIGAASGAAGAGAAIGAGAGLLLGSIVGAGNAQASGYAVQSAYDAGYLRCMYASGNRVPAVAQAYPVVRPAVVYPAPYYPYYRP
jgi:hypothetical protein